METHQDAAHVFDCMKSKGLVVIYDSEDGDFCVGHNPPDRAKQCLRSDSLEKLNTALIRSFNY